MNLEELITRVPNLQRIVKSMPNNIKDKIRIKKLPAKTTIQRKDDELLIFSIICEGEVRVINEFENGNVYMIEENKAIDFIGEVAALANEKVVSVTIQSVTDCILLQMSIDDFNNWINIDKNFLMILARRISKKLYYSSYSKGVELFYPATHTMLNLLIKYSENMNLRKRIQVKLTRQQMADILGISVRTVNRSLKKLKEESVISIEKGKVNISPEQFKKIIWVFENKRYL